MKIYSAPSIDVIKVDVKSTFATYGNTSACEYVIAFHQGSGSNNSCADGGSLMLGFEQHMCISTPHDGYDFI